MRRRIAPNWQQFHRPFRLRRTFPERPDRHRPRTSETTVSFVTPASVTAYASTGLNYRRCPKGIPSCTPLARIAPTVRLVIFAILTTGTLSLENFFSSATSAFVQGCRMTRFLPVVLAFFAFFATQDSFDEASYYRELGQISNTSTPDLLQRHYVTSIRIPPCDAEPPRSPSVIKSHVNL